MEIDVLSRTLIAIAITGAGLGVYGLTNKLVLKRASKNNSFSLDNFKPGIPAILYFTTPTCAPCKTVQRPAIQAVQQELGDKLQVIEIDADAQPELANYWGVLSVPTTFIINGKGEPRHINHGVTLVDKLLKQLKKYS